MFFQSHLFQIYPLILASHSNSILQVNSHEWSFSNASSPIFQYWSPLAILVSVPGTLSPCLTSYSSSFSGWQPLIFKFSVQISLLPGSLLWLPKISIGALSWLPFSLGFLLTILFSQVDCEMSLNCVTVMTLMQDQCLHSEHSRNICGINYVAWLYSLLLARVLSSKSRLYTP